MQPLEQLDSLRRRMLLMAAALLFPMTVLRHLGSDGGWWKSAWLFGFALVVAWVAARRSVPERWKVIVPAVLGVGLAPVSCAMDQVGLVETATLLLVPLVLAVLFMDAFDVVVAVSVTGWVANTIFFAWLGWPLEDVATVSGLSGAVLGGVVMAAAGALKLRQLDRLTETEHSQALRLSESRRAQAERLAIVGRLASGVAHEINNPLAFVKANVGALGRSLTGEEPLDEDELDEILGDTTQGIDRICQIVADLKGFSREDSGVVEAVDVHDAVNGAVRLAMVRLPRDVKVSIEVPPGVPLVRASQRKLAQVLLNLLVNAGEALEEMRVLKPSVVIRAVPDGEHLSLSITDNGPGIPPDVMARLFEPFFTTKPPGKGTGLGLALSREYVEAFGGTLSAHNVEPRGAQFCISMKTSGLSGETPVPGTLAVAPPRAMLVSRRRRTGT